MEKVQNQEELNLLEKKEEKIDPSIATLTQEQAIGVLIQGVRIAQSKGVYTLEDAELLSKAIRTFMRAK